VVEVPQLSQDEKMKQMKSKINYKPIRFFYFLSGAKNPKMSLWKNKNCKDWNNAEVVEWISSFRFGDDVNSMFRENEVVGADLGGITGEDLKNELGVKNFAIRKRILKEIGDIVSLVPEIAKSPSLKQLEDVKEKPKIQVPIIILPEEVPAVIQKKPIVEEKTPELPSTAPPPLPVEEVPVIPEVVVPPKVIPIPKIVEAEIIAPPVEDLAPQSL
jgi:hypothetical protein